MSNSQTTSSDDAGWDVEAIKSELVECLKGHSCGGSDVLPPTRLLDVGGPDPGRISLVVSAAENIGDGRYAALSYVWGLHQPFTTTPATLSERLTGFPPEELPRTIRDAVQVTRDLGYRYLWVDALCILQGRTPEAVADWQRESATMEAVYSNAVFTIVAAGAQHCDAGIFPFATDDGARKRHFKDEPDDSKLVAEVVSCNVDLVAADPYGAVRGGRLVVRSAFKTGSKIRLEDGCPELDDGDARLASLWLDDDTGKVLAEVQAVTRFYCLQISTRDGNTGILLVDADDAGNQGTGLFRRIGFFCCADTQSDAWDDAPRREFTIV